MTIARAMLLRSQMLILDEATSNVDTRTEIQIQSACSFSKVRFHNEIPFPRHRFKKRSGEPPVMRTFTYPV